ncbi:hypothetical protein QEZ54_18340 [Catellatospora sp. KI3]|uniref:hypothetical protein n=1 Tax=Catellatospora sp. KI3 TaxID=3041620 RepID=UPI002483290A|nr:hypothetical protein [Catellatospora sp. KI3]MDI1462940.1 hypothetical protein [Catellatospora sp. KI3]
MTSPDTYQQLWLLACRRVKQYQTTTNVITGASLGISALLLWVALAASGAALLGTLLLVAVVNGAAAVGVSACRHWTRFFHAESEYWLDKLVPAEERNQFLDGFRAVSPMPAALGKLWTEVLTGTAILAALAAAVSSLISSN